MSNNKLISLLTTLTNKEWKTLDKYILTKTKNNTDNYKLFIYTSKNRKSLLSKWDTSDVHNNLFSNITRKTFLNLMSLLYLWTEEWLCLNRIKNEKLERIILLLREFSNRGLFDHVNSLIPSIDKELESIKDNNILYHKYAAEIYHILYFSDNPIKIKEGSKLLRTIINSHTLSSADTALIYLIESKNRRNIYQADFELEEKQLLNLIANRDFPDGHYATLLLKIVEELNLQAFNELKQQLYNDQWTIPSETHTIVTLYLISYCMKFWHLEKIKDTSTITELYDYGLKTEALLHNGTIPEIRFHNIISTIGGLSNNGWSLRFIEQWIHKVQSTDPAQNKNLALAQYNFYKEEYSQITMLLRDIKFKSEGQQIRLMGLQLIAWFEERDEYPDVYYNYSNNFKKYLNRNKNKVSEHYLKSHVNLIKILELIARNAEVEKIKEAYEKATQLIYRKYLRNKIN